MDLDQTQAIELDEYDDDTDEELPKSHQKPVSYLKVLCQPGFPETTFPLYEGDNVIGRQEDSCNIYIPKKALSKQHACIEIRGDAHLIHDKGSRNKSRRGKLFLMPDVRYELKHNDSLTFADVDAVYLIHNEDADSGSETGSESMFTIAANNDNHGDAVVESTMMYDDDDEPSDLSSDLLQPTQAYGAFAAKTEVRKIVRLFREVESDVSDNEGGKKPAYNVTVQDTPAPSRVPPAEVSTHVLPESGSETDNEGAAPQQTLVFDDEKDESDDPDLMCAPTQAYVEDSDDDAVMYTAPTQAFVDENSKSDDQNETETAFDGATLAYASDSDTDMEDNEKIVEVTQAYMMDVTPRSRNKARSSPTPKPLDPTQAYTMDTCPTQNKKMNVSPSRNEKAAKLLPKGGNKVVAKDAYVSDSDDESDKLMLPAEFTDEDFVAETQLFDEVGDARYLFTTSTLACDMEDADSVESINQNADKAKTVIQASDEDATQVVEDDADEGATQVLEGATQVLDERVMQNKAGKRKGKVVEDENATQVLADEVEPVRKRKGIQKKVKPIETDVEATQVLSDSEFVQETSAAKKLTRRSRGKKEDDATMVLPDVDDSEIKEEDTRRLKGIKDDDATQVLSDDATQVIEEIITSKKPKRGRLRGKKMQPVEEEVLLDDGTLNVDEVTTKRGRPSGKKMQPVDEEATQVLPDDATMNVDEVTSKRGRPSRKKMQPVEEEVLPDDATLNIVEVTSKRDRPSSKKMQPMEEEVLLGDATMNIVEVTSKRSAGRRSIRGKKPVAEEREALDISGLEGTGTLDISGVEMKNSSRRGQRNKSKKDKVKIQTNDNIENVVSSKKRATRGGKKGLFKSQTEKDTNDDDTLPMDEAGSDAPTQILPGTTQPVKEVDTRKKITTAVLDEPADTLPALEDLELAEFDMATQAYTNADGAADPPSPDDSIASTVSIDKIPNSTDESSDELPNMLRIPSRSPFKSALAGPKKSPSPKRVAFAVQDDEDDDFMSPVLSNKKTGPIVLPPVTGRSRRSLNLAQDKDSVSSAGTSSKPAVKNTKKGSRNSSVGTKYNAVEETAVIGSGKGRKGSRNSSVGTKYNAVEETASTTAGRGRQKRGQTSEEVTTMKQNKRDISPANEEEKDAVLPKKRGRVSLNAKATGVSAAKEPKNEGPVPSSEDMNGINAIRPGRRKGRKSQSQIFLEEVESTDIKESASKGANAGTKSTNKGRKAKSVADDGEKADADEGSTGEKQIVGAAESRGIRATRGQKKVLQENVEPMEDTATKASKAVVKKGRGKQTKNEENSVDVASVNEATTRQGRSTRGRSSTTPVSETISESSKTSVRQKGHSSLADETENSKKKDENQPSSDTIPTDNLSGYPQPKARGKGRKAATSVSDSGSAAPASGRRSKVTATYPEEDHADATESEPMRPPATAVKATRGRRSTNISTETVPEPMTEQSANETTVEPSMTQGSKRASTSETKGTSVSPAKRVKVKTEPMSPKNTGDSMAAISQTTRRKSTGPKPKVMFTGVVDEDGQKIIRNLGGALVSDVHECTHLVTDKVRRTVKFLCCLSRGLPIVSPSWLESCKDLKGFTDTKIYIICDPAAERQYNFSLHKSIKHASESSLFSGYQIHVTKSVRPEPAQMKEIVKCAGAEYLATIPKTFAGNTLVVSCEEDRTACQAAISADIPIVTAEFILTGILKQRVDVEAYRIFSETEHSQKRPGSERQTGAAKKKR